MDMNDPKQQRWNHAVDVANRAIDESRVQLMLKFRFLDLALWNMPSTPVIAQNFFPLSTDGVRVYFEPYAVAERCKTSFDELIRDYLHVVMHCLFRHPFDMSHSKDPSWWLACDIAAESAAMDLCAGRFPCERDPSRVRALAELQRACDNLTPGKLYPLLRKSADARRAEEGLIPPEKLSEYTSLFLRDNHAAWPSVAVPSLADDLSTTNEISESSNSVQEETPRIQPEAGDAQQGDGSSSDQTDAEPDGTNQGSQDAGRRNDERDFGDQTRGEAAADGDTGDSDQSEVGNDESTAPQPAENRTRAQRRQAEQEWENIAKRAEVDLDTFSKEWGDEAGTLTKLLRNANLTRIDYSEFLKRFTALTEEIVVNDDDFDYSFYMYGLDLYGNMPLIEPLEYKEVQRVRDFVIVIDTSESCEGELVRAFLRHSLSIMKSQEDFSHKVNIHVVQCDAKVQSDTVVTDLRDVDELIESFEVKGMGGTDFRPAFDYVDKLCADGELENLRGMVYFTDGLGTFPTACPPYDVAFAFLDRDDAVEAPIPQWAARVVLSDADLRNL